MEPLIVHQLSPDGRDDYPHLFLPHPRNRGVNWLALDDYAERGVGSGKNSFKWNQRLLILKNRQRLCPLKPV